MTDVDVLIAGGGFSGSMLAVHLARGGVRPVVCDSAAAQGRGRAYGTPDDTHLLNVPAGGMSAFPDAPGHFIDWLKGGGRPSAASDFVPRRLYGEYLRSIRALADVRQADAVAEAAFSRAAWSVLTTDGARLTAPVLVLATGHRLPARPRALAGLTAIADDPYAAGAFADIPADAPVAVMGTGLTAADAILSLRRHGHRGPVVAFSRSGRWPLEHRLGLPPHRFTRGAPRAGARGLVAWVRDEVADARNAGGDPRTVIDALRPATRTLWEALPWPEKARLYRHARSVWDTARHRMPPEVAATIDGMMTTGQLISFAARLISAEHDNAGLTLTLKAKAGPTRQIRGLAKLIIATGTETAPRHGGGGLLDRLHDAGFVSTDPLQLGVLTDSDGRCIGADGSPVTGLYAMGPLRRGTLWENTAVPELRAEAAQLAHQLAGRIRP